MTKQDALQKIEELKKFVEKCDDEGTLEHGDEVYAGPTKEFKRIVIKTALLREHHLGKDYFALDEYGVVQSSFDHPSETITKYTKIRNVFKD